MNSFDKRFFLRYLPEGSEILATIHSHIITILDKVFLWCILGAFLPSFLYTLSYRIQDLVPFYILEIWLFGVFLKVLYDIFDWYLDAWIITNDGIYDLHRKFLKTDIKSIKFESIEGVEIEQFGIWDKIFKKGDLILHQLGHGEVRKVNAENPFLSAEILEGFIHHEEHHEEKKDRFEMIMDTLGAVVEDYLERKGLREKIDGEEDDYLESIRASIDLRSEKEREKHQKRYEKKETKKEGHDHGGSHH